jgi:ribonucleoside-diphosphate reductase alpha chain
MLSVIGNEITQGGKRNGANMALLPISHPDILEFISAKEVDGSLFNFNFSVAISDSVMKGVERGDENPIFESLVDHAWANGEPGVLFPDTVNAANSTPKLGLLLGVNPCGEMPLYTFESCALGSINLLNFFKPPTEPWSGPHEDWVKVSIDWDRFQDTIRTAVRFLDNGIDVNLFPLPQITEASRRLRKIGLGVMGFADLLLRLKIPYGSPHSIDLARVLARTLTETAIYVSQQLAIERGNFPAWKESRYAEEPFATPMRNALCTTIAPTGSISMIANVSPGIEPVYAYEWTKTVMEGTKLEYSHPFYKEHKDEEDYAGVFVSAHDVTPTEHIEMQAAWQEFIHNAISKTANMPETATREDVKAAYILAWKLGCKGLTVYRDGSRSGQVYEKVEEKITEVEQAALEGDADARAGRFVPEAEVFPEESPDVELEGRPRYTVGVTGHFPTGCGTLHLTVNEYPTDTPFELYATMGHSGGCAISMLEAIGRLISMALTNGEPIEDIVHHLKGISCPMKCYDDGKLNLSCSDVIARMLTENPGVEQVFHSYKKVEPWQAPTNGKKKAVLEALAMPEKMRTGGGICFMCGQDSIVFQDGCKSCTSCGESFCG